MFPQLLGLLWARRPSTVSPLQGLPQLKSVFFPQAVCPPQDGLHPVTGQWKGLKAWPPYSNSGISKGSLIFRQFQRAVFRENPSQPSCPLCHPLPFPCMGSDPRMRFMSLLPANLLRVCSGKPTCANLSVIFLWSQEGSLLFNSFTIKQGNIF